MCAYSEYWVWHRVDIFIGTYAVARISCTFKCMWQVRNVVFCHLGAGLQSCGGLICMHSHIYNVSVVCVQWA